MDHWGSGAPLFYDNAAQAADVAAIHEDDDEVCVCVCVCVCVWWWWWGETVQWIPSTNVTHCDMMCFRP
jgi:hypothetical protein